MDDTAPSSKPSLMRRTRSGVLWVGVVMIGSKLLTVATTLILARILAPSDFGLVAVSGIVISALALFTDLGFGAAIIHSKADRQRMASTAFFIMPVIGLGLYLLAFVNAPTLANLLGSPGAAAIIRIVAINILLSSLTIVPSVLLEKDMAYRRKVIPDLAPTLIYIPVTLVLAARLHWGAYSIAWGLVAMAGASLILNWAIAKWRPSWVFDWAIARDLTRYGRNVLGGSLVAYLATNLDNAFVSRAVGTAGLGFYTLAYSITNLPATHVADVLGRVLFPSFVELSDDPARLRQAYVRALRILIVVTLPMLVGLAILAGPFVEIVMGQRWLAMAPVMQGLVVFVGLRVLAGPTGSLFLATNNTRFILLNGMTGVALQTAALYLALYIWELGIVGAAWAVGVASLFNALYIAYCVHQIFPYRPSRLMAPALKLLVPGAVMGAVMAVLGLLLPVSPWALALAGIAGVAAYLASLVVMGGRRILEEIWRLVRRSPV